MTLRSIDDYDPMTDLDLDEVQAIAEGRAEAIYPYNSWGWEQVRTLKLIKTIRVLQKQGAP